MNEEILRVIDDYLDSVIDRTGLGWTSHSDADYVYWANDSDRRGATSYLVSACDLEAKGLVDLKGDSIVLSGPWGEVSLPIKYDYGKIRRRVEDALRKNVRNEDLLRIAGITGIKLN